MTNIVVLSYQCAQGSTEDTRANSATLVAHSSLAPSPQGSVPCQGSCAVQCAFVLLFSLWLGKSLQYLPFVCEQGQSSCLPLGDRAGRLGHKDACGG